MVIMSKCVNNASAMNPYQSRNYKSVIWGIKKVLFCIASYIVFDENRGHFAKKHIN